MYFNLTTVQKSLEKSLERKKVWKKSLGFFQEQKSGRSGKKSGKKKVWVPWGCRVPENSSDLNRSRGVHTHRSLFDIRLGQPCKILKVIGFFSGWYRICSNFFVFQYFLLKISV